MSSLSPDSRGAKVRRTSSSPSPSDRVEVLAAAQTSKTTGSRRALLSRRLNGLLSRGLAVLVLTCPVGYSQLMAGDASKVHEVLTSLKAPRQGTEPQRFELTEEDLNAWIEVALNGRKGQGVEKISVDLREENRVMASALIDLDKVELSGYSASLFGTVLSGVQLVEAVGMLQVQDGTGSFEAESTSINGISVPAWLVNQVLSYLSSSQPPNVDITQPFLLPFEITDIRVTSASVVIMR